MTEFLFGFASGLGVAIAAAVFISFCVVGARSEEPDPESQDDIRLTKINSTYVRTTRHD